MIHPDAQQPEYHWLPLYTNVPCGGICDEIEEWASLEDGDDSIDYPCEGCIYEYYLTGEPNDD